MYDEFLIYIFVLRKIGKNLINKNSRNMEREKKINCYKKNWEGIDVYEIEVSIEGNIIIYKGERERDGDKNMFSFKKVKKKNLVDLEDI